MNRTNVGLVEHAEKLLAGGTGYVYGTFYQKLTTTLLAQKQKQYPANIDPFIDFIKSNWMGMMVTDCVGLIKSYIWMDASGVVKYDPKTDVSANGMLGKAKVKGPINTIPDVEGLLVWKSGHIGVYIGGGFVIESNSTKKGVIKTPLKGSGATKWTDWCECPFIEYETVKDELSEALELLKKKGVIDSPDYWIQTAQEGKTPKGEYVRKLIISMSKKL